MIELTGYEIILNLDLLSAFKSHTRKTTLSDEVARCRASPDPAEPAKHLDVNSKGKCAGAPRLFKQCYCDPIVGP